MKKGTLSLVLFIVMAPLVICAQDQNGTKKTIDTVLYSYEKWDRVQPKQYVMVPTPVTIANGTLAERTRALLTKLKKAKRNTYGNVRPAFKPDSEKTGEVYIYLDQSALMKKYHAIVIAETVYTFTENGARKVIFPKVKATGLTRQDIPNSAYVLSAPFWRILPPANMANTFVRLPDDQIRTASQIIGALKKGDAEILKIFWSQLAEGGAAALATIKASTLLNIANREQKLLLGLDSSDAQVRKATLKALKGVDKDAVNTALRKVMDEDPKKELQSLAATMLSTSANPNFAASARFYALKSDDPKQVLAAVNQLKTSKAKDATKRLITTLAHTDPLVRQTVMDVLVERNDLKTMIASLSDQKLAEKTRMELALKLRTLKSKEAKEASLVFIVTQGDGPDAVLAANQLRDYSSKDALTALGRALKHKEVGVRRKAAESLGHLGNSSSLSDLAQADIKDSDTGPDILKAIQTIYGKQSMSFVMKATGDKNPVLKRCAVAALGRLVQTSAGRQGKGKIVATLKGLSRSKDAEIRASVVTSLGAIGDASVKSELFKFTDDKSIEVKRALASALRSYPGPKTVTLLLGYLQANDPETVANAAKTIGILKVKEGMNPIINLRDNKDVRVRRSASKALAELGTTMQEKDPLLRLFADYLQDADLDVRMNALDGLRLVKDGRAIAAMAPLVQDKELAIRVKTVEVMGASGHKSAVEGINPALEDDNKMVRLAAAKALATLKSKTAIPILKAQLAIEKDAEVKDALSQALKAIQ